MKEATSLMEIKRVWELNFCGDCQMFMPKPGDRFFKCTGAMMKGKKAEMDVRPNSPVCEAFMPVELRWCGA